jgi:hypothetical protein
MHQIKEGHGLLLHAALRCVQVSIWKQTRRRKGEGMSDDLGWPVWIQIDLEVFEIHISTRGKERIKL